MASDLFHWWGNDLSLTPSGDIALADSFAKDNQRIVRRLCTAGNTAGALIGEYVFHPDYGGSAPWYVGRTQDAQLLQGLIRSQMYQEQSVSHQPEPIVAATLSPDGSFSATIFYTDADTGAQVPPLTFSVS